MKAIDVSEHSTLMPKYLRLPDAIRYSGICRSGLYTLLNNGTIKSKSLRKPGNARGIRLVSVESLDAFLESLPDSLPKDERAAS